MRTPDLEAIRNRAAVTVQWGTTGIRGEFLPAGDREALATVEDVRALLAEVDRLREIISDLADNPDAPEIAALHAAAFRRGVKACAVHNSEGEAVGGDAA